MVETQKFLSKHTGVWRVSVKEEQARLIKTLRRKAGLTQKQLSQRSGLALVTIKEIETGVTMPRLETLFSVADGLGIEAETIIIPLWHYWKGRCDTALEASAQFRIQQERENQ